LLTQRYPPDRFCIVRPPAVYGPGDRATLSLFRALRHRLAFLPGDAEARFSLIYVDDLARAIGRLLDWPDWDGSVVEPDDGHSGGYRWADLTAVASAHLGHRVRPVHLPQAVLWVPVGLYQEIARLFGAAPMVTIEKLRELFHRDWVCRLLPDCFAGMCRGATQFTDGFAVTWRWYLCNRWL
jgi:nucleoside-diphosphate-sugar epimerase